LNLLKFCFSFAILQWHPAGTPDVPFGHY